MPDTFTVTTLPTAEPVSLDEMKLHLRVDFSSDDALIMSLIRVAREYAEDVTGKAYMVRTCRQTYDYGWPEIFYLIPPLVSVGLTITYDLAGTTTTLASTEYTIDAKSEPARIYPAYGKYWPVVRSIRNTITVNYITGYGAQFNANSSTDYITAYGRTYTDDDKVRVWTTGGSAAALPKGLSAYADYYVINQSASTFQVSTTLGGNALDIENTGTGAHFIGHPDFGEVPEKIIAAMKLLVGHWYEHREELIGAVLRPVPLAAAALLNQNRINW